MTKRRRLTRQTRRRLILATVLAVLVGGTTAGIVLAAGAASRAADRRGIAAYDEAVEPLAFEGGRLIQEDVKPRITDLREGLVEPEQFRREAENWILRYQDLRDQFAGLERPARLDEVARLYDEAFATYIRAFEAFRDAAALPTQEQRNQAITDAVPIAEQADEIYDRARTALNAQMRAVGLEPPPEFTDTE